MIQFFGTLKAPEGIAAEVKVVGCPALKEIQPFEPI
jgi:hypothetical protein